MRKFIHNPTSLSLFALLLFTSGCAVGPNFKAPEAPLPDAFVSSAQNANAQPIEDQLTNWWKQYNDPMLETLIDRALKENLELESALASVSRSRALLLGSKSELYPSGNATGALTRTQRSEEVQGGVQPGTDNPSDLYELGLSANWEIDLFGGRRRAVEAAVAELKAAQADVAATRLMVSAEVADAYFAWLGAQKRLQVAEATVETYRGTLTITQARYTAGFESQFDQVRAEAELNSSVAQTPPLREEVALQRNRLAVLLGTTPGNLPELTTASAQLPLVPTFPVTGLSPQLLRRRPDIRSAEQSIVAANARIGESIAEYYPKFSLNGTLGFASTDSENLLQSKAGTWSIGPSFQWRLLDFGRVESEIRRAKANERMVLSSYKQTVITSVREAEDALVQLDQRAQEVRALEQATKSQKRALEIANARFQSGLEELLVVLDAQRTLNAVQTNLITAKQRQLQASSALYKSLGGGWEAQE